MASYILRDIDPELWPEVKSKAALEEKSVKLVIETLLREWVKTPAQRPRQVSADAGSAEHS